MIKAILIVSNDAHKLKKLHKAFTEEGHSVRIAETSQKAEEAFGENTIDAVLCDLDVLKSDKSQLLETLKKNDPASLLMIMADNTEDPIVIQHLSDGKAIKSIPKALKSVEIVRIVHNIFETENLLLNTHILDFISKLEELPTLKTIYSKINELISQDASVSEIVALIEQDPAISTKLLRIANSALFGLKTGSIQQALAYLGFSNLKNLILSTAVIESLHVPGAYHPLVNQIWIHSFYTEKVTRMIYEKLLQEPIAQTALLAGLLHNIGSIMLLKYHPVEYLEIRKQTVHNGKNISHEEAKEFGVSHEDAGGYLLKWWGLPYSLIEVAVYHHYPFAKHVVDKKLVAAVHIAQHYSYKALNQKDYQNFEDKAFEVLGIDQASFETEFSKIQFDDSAIL